MGRVVQEGRGVLENNGLKRVIKIWNDALSKRVSREDNKNIMDPFSMMEL